MNHSKSLMMSRQSFPEFKTTNSPKSLVNRNQAISIEPPCRWEALDFCELWKYRELLYFLAWRDVKVRYKQTVIGAAWAMFQPLMTTIVFTALFGKFADVPSDGIPYAIFALAALLPWNLFAGALNRSTASVVSEAHLISK